mmetsp:Transcript_26165/g.47488  ORF Transcript_26165/g.47488 Transcript_26165/m.47488 type:complete len:768 (-) Transcript_26165:131-2434(-)
MSESVLLRHGMEENAGGHDDKDEDENGGTEARRNMRKHNSNSRIRGMENTGGLSCHLGSALQLLYHGCHIQRYVVDTAAAAAPHSNEEDHVRTLIRSVALRELGRLCTSLAAAATVHPNKDGSFSSSFTHEDNAVVTAVNPLALYRVLSSPSPSDQKTHHTNMANNAISFLNSKALGDAALAVRTLLGLISNCLDHEMMTTTTMTTTTMSEEEEQESKMFWTAAFDLFQASFVTRVTQQIIGTCTTSTTTTTATQQETNMNTRTTATTTTTQRRQRQRQQPLQERTLMVPLAIPVVGNYPTVESSLDIFFHRPISGYQWSTTTTTTTDSVESTHSSIPTTHEDDSNNSKQQHDDETNDDDDDDNEENNFNDSKSISHEEEQNEDSTCSSDSSCSDSDDSLSSSSSTSSEENRSDDEEVWNTYQETRFVSLPPQHLPLHLKRFQFQPSSGGGGGVQFVSQVMNVPLELNLQPYCTTTTTPLSPPDETKNNGSDCTCSGAHYHLTGAIVHVGVAPDDRTSHDAQESSEEPFGHCIALVRVPLDQDTTTTTATTTHMKSKQQQQYGWVQLDDEDVLYVAHASDHSMPHDDAPAGLETDRMSALTLDEEQHGQDEEEQQQEEATTLLAYTEQDVLDLLSGRRTKGLFHSKRVHHETAMVMEAAAATVLLYSRVGQECPTHHDSENPMKRLTQILRETTFDMMDPQERLVGRRVGIQWAKGNIYWGTVMAYDATTGKHRVKYDDGDIRDYTLSKKKVTWGDDKDSSSSSPPP